MATIPIDAAAQEMLPSASRSKVYTSAQEIRTEILIEIALMEFKSCGVEPFFTCAEKALLVHYVKSRGEIAAAGGGFSSSRRQQLVTRALNQKGRDLIVTGMANNNSEMKKRGEILAVATPSEDMVKEWLDEGALYLHEETRLKQAENINT